MHIDKTYTETVVEKNGNGWTGTDELRAKWQSQYELTCSYIQKMCRLEEALGALVDAVNVEFQGFPNDIGGKTGPALIEAVNALASVAPKPDPMAWRKPIADLEAQVQELTKQNAKLQTCLCFFSSVIKSGEGWSATCKQEMTAAMNPASHDTH